MKYTREQLRRQILEILYNPMSDETWPEEVLELLKSQMEVGTAGAEVLLFGESESVQFSQGFVPKIKWTSYNPDGSEGVKERFGLPLAQVADKVCSRIKNATYVYEGEQLSLFPEQTEQYATSLIKEIINNLLVHVDYRQQSYIYINEFEDRLEFIGEGTFFSKFLQNKQEGQACTYRNAALYHTMVKNGLLEDGEDLFEKAQQIQCEKGLPLPIYDIKTPNRIQIVLYGKVLDQNYKNLLTSRNDLDLQTIFLLDKVQKQESISKEEYQSLRKKGLVEGRYPNIFVSYKIAGETGLKTSYVKNKGLGDDVYKKVLLNALKTMESANVRELYGVLKGALPDVMDKKQQARKISNLLQAMKKQGVVKSKGTGQSARWFLAE